MSYRTKTTLDLPAASKLTDAELKELTLAEETIRNGIYSFVNVGKALKWIRDERLYRGTDATFDGYLKRRWHISRSHCSRLIGAAETVEVLPRDNITEQATEKHLRPLLAFPLEHRAQVWEKATYGDKTLVSASVIARHIENEIAISQEPHFKQVRLERKRRNREIKADSSDKESPSPLVEDRVSGSEADIEMIDAAIGELHDILSKPSMLISLVAAQRKCNALVELFAKFKADSK